jgi:hypothetical protein
MGPVPPAVRCPAVRWINETLTTGPVPESAVAGALASTAAPTRCSVPTPEGTIVAAYTIRVIRNDRESTELARVTVDTSTNQARVSGSPAVDLDLLLRAFSPPVPQRPAAAEPARPSRPVAARARGARRRRSALGDRTLVRAPRGGS